MSRPRGSVTKRYRNSWLIKFDVPAIDGKRQQRYATIRGTRKEAEAKLVELLAKAQAGLLPAPTADTVADYLRSWLTSAHTQAPKTLERYGELAANQIEPHLGKYKLQALRPEHVQRWHRTLLDAGLAARTIGHAHRLLVLVLQSAVINGRLARNVANVHKPPRVDQEEIEILTADQIADVRAKLQGHTLLPIVELALGTGMRRGELLGLQWGDIDLDAGTLRVERSLEETNAGLRPKSPKTKRGRRNIKLSPETVAMLRAHKVAQLQVRLILGAGKLEDDAPVFCTVEGRPIRPRNITKAWSRVVPDRTFHSLRHTHASTLIAAGVDILSISRRLGHSKVSITLDCYGHLMPGGDEAAAAAISKVLK